jgi:hypothetical protein
MILFCLQQKDLLQGTFRICQRDFFLDVVVEIYHRAMDFNHYVQEEVTLTNSERSLKEILLLKAEQDHLPITDQNIDITKNGPELRVSVEYQVPLDLILIQKLLTFHSTGVHID